MCKRQYLKWLDNINRFLGSLRRKWLGPDNRVCPSRRGVRQRENIIRVKVAIVNKNSADLRHGHNQS